MLLRTPVPLFYSRNSKNNSKRRRRTLVCRDLKPGKAGGGDLIARIHYFDKVERSDEFRSRDSKSAVGTTSKIKESGHFIMVAPSARTLPQATTKLSIEIRLGHKPGLQHHPSYRQIGVLQ